jgi:GT2 family glycosyltransferase
MVDTDIVFVPDDVLQLMKTMQETGADIVTGLYKEGYPPHQWSIFDDKLGHPTEFGDKPFEIGACGMGFCLMNKKAMTICEKPFDPITENDVRYGEDVSFCVRAKKKGLKIVCEPNVKVGHLRLQEL